MSVLKNVYLLLFLLPVGLFGQNGNWYFHFNQPHYTDGEYVLLNVLTPANEATGEYLKMDIFIDDSLLNERYVERGRLGFNTFYKIPIGTPSGVLSFRTRMYDGEKKEFAAYAGASVFLFNKADYQSRFFENAILGRDSVERSAMSQELKPSNASKLGLQVDSSNQENRKSLKITLIDPNGIPIPARFSISVTGSALQTAVQRSELPQAMLGGVRDNPINGLAKSRNGEVLANASINAYSPREFLFYFGFTDAQGAFSFSTPIREQTNPLVFYDEHLNRIEVDIHSDELGPHGSLPQPNLSSSKVRDYIGQVEKRRIVYQMYNEVPELVKKDDATATQPVTQPDKSYDITEYQEFRSFSDFFLESGITHLKVKGTHEVIDQLNVFNMTVGGQGGRDLFPGSPLIIIDGELTLDIDAPNKIDFDVIRQVDLYSEVKKLRATAGQLALNKGILAISTDRKVVPSFDYQMTGLQSGFSFKNDRVNREKTEMMEPQLYWSTMEQTQDGPEMHTVAFVESPVYRKYTIEVLAIDEDGEVYFRTLDY